MIGHKKNEIANMMMISTTGGEISAREKDSNRAYFKQNSPYHYLTSAGLKCRYS